MIRLASASRWATSRPPPKLAHVGDHLVRARVALVGAEDRHAAGVQRVRRAPGRWRRPPAMYSRAEREQLGRGGGERGDAVDLVRGGERGEDGVQQRRGERRGRSRPSRPTAGRENVLPALPVITAAPSASGSWNWPPAIRPSWCAPSKKTLPPHSRAIAAISFTGQREEGHARAERDQLRAVLRGRRARRRRGRPRAPRASNGTSTMFRPRMPAGPSWRLELWPPTGCGIVITVSPGSVSAA